jgi:hypothetical protein
MTSHSNFEDVAEAIVLAILFIGLMFLWKVLADDLRNMASWEA